MKKSLTLVFFVPLVLFGQVDTIIEYKDKGEIESIEYFCVQGKFHKKTNELIQEGPRGFNCRNGSIDHFDNRGNLISSENKYYYSSPNEEIRFVSYSYDNGRLTKEASWSATNHSDTINYSWVLLSPILDNRSVDSSFLSNGELEWKRINYYDLNKNCFYSELHFCIDSSVLHIDSFFYDKNGITNRHYKGLARNNSIIEETNTYTLISRAHIISFTLSGIDTTNYTHQIRNDSGLVIYDKYIPGKNNEHHFLTPYELTYRYIYDANGNWVEKYIYKQGILICIERRKITYYFE